MSLQGGVADDCSMDAAAANNRASDRGAGLLIAHCTALDQERPAVVDRLQRLLGPDLTRLLLVALVGDHRMGPRDLIA
jgi:hypothetical protein